ncbi:MAG TPA: heme-binding protein [Candidatus Sulfotelmatobacter sp.]|nr:heme-binding protein [Candidatus Sulfotelmatobacter sp.]
MRLFTISALAGAALLLAHPVAAQVPTPAPAGGTPDRMPFAIPYGPSITAARAARVVDAVLAEAAKHPSWAFAISVVDPHGELVYFYRMDDVQYASIAISQGKARTAARFRRESRVFYNAEESGHPYVSTLDPGLVASPGGFPLVENGHIIGAVGCSGGTGDQDATVCKAGAESIR